MKQEFNIQTSRVIYDSTADALTAKFNGTNTSHSINVHDFLIIDLTEDNRIIGLELLDFSEMFNFDKLDLSSIEGITLNIVYDRESRELLLKVNLDIKNKIRREIIIQPIKYEKPISN